MIRINLLPVRQTKKRETVQQQLLAFVGVIILTILGCIAWTAYNSREASNRRDEIANRQKELAQLDKIIGEVNEFTTKKKELEDKLKVIDQLKKGKTGPVRALDDLATEIPNRVWLTKVDEKSGSVTLDGVAIDHEDVSAFMKALQKSKYFSNIVLGYSKKTTDQAGTTLYEFKITCRVDYAA
ncbi:PilN domain-containing protein [Myxococcota bacterium]|nr:PilN domain-containing protein [Myxococcota bacterium]